MEYTFTDAVADALLEGTMTLPEIREMIEGAENNGTIGYEEARHCRALVRKAAAQ